MQYGPAQAQWTVDGFSRVLQVAPLPGKKDPPVITALAVSCDRNLLAAAGDDHAIRLFDVQSGRLIATLVGHLDWVKCLKFSSDSSRLYSCGNDRRLRYWNSALSWEGDVLYEGDFALFEFDLHPDEDRIAICGFGDQIIELSTKNGELLRRYECSISDLRSIRYAPSGEMLAAGGRNGQLLLWDVLEGTLISEQRVHEQRLENLIFRGDGEMIQSVARDRTLSRFDVVLNEQTDRHAIQCGKMTALAQLDSLLTAIATADNSIRLFCWMEQSEIRKLIGHQGSVSVLVITDDTLYSGSFDTTIRAWDIEEIVLAQTRLLGPRILR